MLTSPQYIQVGSIYASPGGKAAGYLRPITPAGAVELPVVVAHGAQPGPRLALVGGVHGSEYPGIAATMTVMRELDPTQLSGAVIGLIVANVPAFRGRREKTCPLDDKNLAAVFPGNPQGSASEVIAHVIQREIIDQADFVIELHGGDLVDRLTPFAIYTRTGNEKIDEQSLGLARCYGVPIIQVPSWDGRFAHKGGLYSTAAELGKPAFVAEAGEHAESDPAALEVHRSGIRNVLRHLGMLPGDRPTVPPTPVTSRYVSMRSPMTGLLWPRVAPGKVVAEDEVVAEIADYFGNVLCAVRAPIGGTVLFCADSLSVQTGESLMGIADLPASA